MLKIPSEFGGLGKHQNNTACTGEGKKKISVHSVEVGHCGRRRDEMCSSVTMTNYGLLRKRVTLKAKIHQPLLPHGLSVTPIKLKCSDRPMLSVSLQYTRFISTDKVHYFAMKKHTIISNKHGI